MFCFLNKCDYFLDYHNSMVYDTWYIIFTYHTCTVLSMAKIVESRNIFINLDYNIKFTNKHSCIGFMLEFIIAVSLIHNETVH